MLASKDKNTTESDQLKKALTTMYGGESKSKKTIKESLSKGLYNLDHKSGKE